MIRIQQVEQAQRALDHYASITDQRGIENSNLVISLLADLMHYCQRDSISFRQAVDDAKQNFHFELESTDDD